MRYAPDYIHDQVSNTTGQLHGNGGATMHLRLGPLERHDRVDDPMTAVRSGAGTRIGDTPMLIVGTLKTWNAIGFASPTACLETIQTARSVRLLISSTTISTSLTS